jgi:hypothetical protein
MGSKNCEVWRERAWGLKFLGEGPNARRALITRVSLFLVLETILL